MDCRGLLCQLNLAVQLARELLCNIKLPWCNLPLLQSSVHMLGTWSQSLHDDFAISKRHADFSSIRCTLLFDKNNVLADRPHNSFYQSSALRKIKNDNETYSIK